MNAISAPFRFVPWNDPSIGPAVELPPMPYGVSKNLGRLIAAYVTSICSGDDEEYKQAFLPIEAYRARSLPDVVAKHLISLHRDNAGLANDCEKLLIIVRDVQYLRRMEALLADLYAQMPQDWVSAKFAYDAARVADEEYYQRVWTPAYDAEAAGGQKAPAAVNAECERLQMVRAYAENILLDIPSPNLASFAVKYLICHDENRSIDIYIEEMCADAKRLLAEGGAA